MNDSILTTIKKLLGIGEEDTAFDTDIVVQINMVFNILLQLGVGPVEGFSISDSSATWSNYLSDISKLEMVKSYIYMKVRLAFDPPSTGSLMEALKAQIAELEWRLNVQVDPGEEDGL